MGTPTNFFESYTSQVRNVTLIQDPITGGQILFHINTPHILVFEILT